MLACVCVRAHVYNFPLGIACRRLRAHLARETRPLGVSAAAALELTAGSAGRITDIIGPTSRVCVCIHGLYSVLTRDMYRAIRIYATVAVFHKTLYSEFFRILDFKNVEHIITLLYAVISRASSMFHLSEYFPHRLQG